MVRYCQIKIYLFMFTTGILFSGMNTELSAGEYAADFTRIGVGARPLAMGGAYIAVANDVSAGYWNPAGLTDNDFFTLQVEHVPMFDGLAQYNTASAVLCFNEQTAVGLSWIRLGVDEIPRYGALQGSKIDRLQQGQFRSTGVPEGYFSDQENAFMLSFSRSLFFDLLLGGGFSQMVVPTQISIGVTGKYIHQKLDKYAGSGQGLDAGVLVRFIPRLSDEYGALTWISFAATVRDLAQANISWNTESQHEDKVKRIMLAGTALSHTVQSIHTRITLAYDYEYSPLSDHYAGGELSFYDTISLRGGYYRKNLTAGAGISFYRFGVDYAFVAGDLGNTHRVSGSFSF
ncbi:hypothetical protein JXO59_05225 [candidate division KSB1 bacterium]|nr:hypothetical protein [candidate division KSB1 bacterium]